VTYVQVTFSEYWRDVCSPGPWGCFSDRGTFPCAACAVLRRAVGERQSDAACRVIARLIRERDEARHLLAQAERQLSTGRAARGGRGGARAAHGQWEERWEAIL